MNDCRACTRPHKDQAVLCPQCTEAVRVQVASIPAWASQLEVTRTRQAKTGGMNVGVINRSEERPLPWDQRASRSARRLRVELVSAIRTLEPRVHQHPVDTLEAMGIFLLGRVNQWRHHDDAVGMWERIAAALDDVERTVDRAPSRVFLGVCSVVHNDVACSGEVFAREHAHEATCDICGCTHDVEYRRRSMLDHLESLLLSATECSRAVSTLYRPVSPDLIRKWVERDRLTAHGVNAQGRPTYRVSDVLDLMVEREAS